MINALRYTRELEEAGFTKDQANTSLKVLVDLMDQNFATNERLEFTEKVLRSDLDRVESSIRSDMRQMEKSIRSDMEKMEQSIRADMKEMEQSIRADMKEMEQSIRSEIQLLHHKIDSTSDKLTIRLSGVIVVAMTILKFVG